MRATFVAGDFKVRVIAGTHTVLMAIDCEEPRRHGLLGFGFKRQRVGDPAPAKWLRSQKVFKSVVPDPRVATDPADPSRPARFDTGQHPVQSFLWGDYGASPGTAYRYSIVPMYGAPGALQAEPALDFEIQTEKEFADGHGVWFNRGAIASQAFAERFGNKGPEPANNPDPNDPATKWLSCGLLEACLAYIRAIPAGDAMRVAAYEFTYKPLIDELKAAVDRGVDVQVVYHDTTKLTDAGTRKDGANEKAIKASALPKTHGGKQVLFPRTKTKIPHNKFILRLEGGVRPKAVWTGSTNFTPSGFLGQTNVGHVIEDDATAEQFLAYWNVLRTDPEREDARAAVMSLTPNPPKLPPPRSITQVFSPRPTSDLLKWYAARIDDAATSVMFTAAFGVAQQLVPALVKESDHLRFLLMEKPPTTALKVELDKDRDLITSYGSVLGQMYKFVDGEPRARENIKDFALDRWLLKEDHFRDNGFVFFIHTKFLLIDPLSDDPLICSGSANFSSNSLLQNDENMLLIRGDTRVADIYLTEFDRIFRHFYFRLVANEIEAEGGEAEGVFLSEDSAWTDGYFTAGRFKTRRREMFFVDTSKTWVDNALEP